MDLIKLAISVLISMSAGALGGLATSKKISSWYQTLEKPLLNPPDWVFGPIWTILYLLIGISLYLVWTSKSKVSKKTAYIIFSIQLFLNTLWSIVFFGLEQTWLALGVILALVVSVVYMIKIFRLHSKFAGYLLWPYLAWISFATYLNLAIAIFN